MTIHLFIYPKKKFLKKIRSTLIIHRTQPFILVITEIHIYHPYIHLHIPHPSKYTCTCTYQFTIIKNNSFIQSSFRSEPKKKRPCICLIFSTGSPHLLRKSVNRIATAYTYALVPSFLRNKRCTILFPRN